jgi:threonine synthase
VDDDAIEAARVEMADLEGILLCPEGAATYAAYQKELASGRLSAEESVVLFNCATGLKYDMPPVTAALDRHKPIDYAAMM